VPRGVPVLTYGTLRVWCDVPWSPFFDFSSQLNQIYELVTGKQLFGPWPDIEGYPVEDVLLCQMMGLLGPFPKDVLAAGKCSSDFFDEKGV
jgi:hypothetical protein